MPSYPLQSLTNFTSLIVIMTFVGSTFIVYYLHLMYKWQPRKTYIGLSNILQKEYTCGCPLFVWMTYSKSPGDAETLRSDAAAFSQIASKVSVDLSTALHAIQRRHSEKNP